MKSSLLLQTFEGVNEQVPVWFMRQAGRYLPEYQALRSKYSLEEMFKTPELASIITCQPINILDVDAAILFADILTLPSAMGVNIHFDNTKGPIVEKIKHSDIEDFNNLDHITKTIKLIKEMLAPYIPLIGFAGSPFTVLTYLIEGGSSTNFRKTLNFMFSQPEDYHQLMDKLTRNTISYIQLQTDAGIDVFQIFDTWAGILRSQDYARFVLPYLQRIYSQMNIPSIYYARGANHLLRHMDTLDTDFLSICHTTKLGTSDTLSLTQKGIQGNLFNALLYSQEKELKSEVMNILDQAKKHPKFIFNLSHGIMPDMAVEKLKFIVQTVHEYTWKKIQ